MADETQELLILPVRDIVLFPGVVLPIAVNRPGSTAAAQEAVRTHSRIGFLLQKDPSVEDPSPTDLHRIGTVASIARFVTAADGVHHLICQGEQRFEVLEFIEGGPHLKARVKLHPDPESTSREVEARALYLRDRSIEALQ
ncbi:MAG TPA: LON peptidase substrate-binding domain-containing protein, partial [Steroidobacteraceae bacterium]|nr:LON peptidase substrate-binding domain-containing protein [Steroidobacteraceae bacterium]